jgi:hypothetical protein
MLVNEIDPSSITAYDECVAEIANDLTQVKTFFAERLACHFCAALGLLVLFCLLVFQFDAPVLQVLMPRAELFHSYNYEYHQLKRSAKYNGLAVVVGVEQSRAIRIG